jgi:hypothetical protein
MNVIFCILFLLLLVGDALAQMSVKLGNVTASQTTPILFRTCRNGNGLDDTELGAQQRPMESGDCGAVSIRALF